MGAQQALSEAQHMEDLLGGIFDVLKEALPASNLEEAVSVIAQRRLQGFLERRGAPTGEVSLLRRGGEPWASVWARLRAQFRISLDMDRPLGAYRGGLRVIVIGP